MKSGFRLDAITSTVHILNLILVSLCYFYAHQYNTCIITNIAHTGLFIIPAGVMFSTNST